MACTGRKKPRKRKRNANVLPTERRHSAKKALPALKGQIGADLYRTLLNSDVQRIILVCLSPIDLVQYSSVDKLRLEQVRTDKVYPQLWPKLCLDLWSDKVYVPRFILKEKPSMLIYFSSVRDSKRQTFLNEDELSEQHFHFRFRLQAGYYWYGQDASFLANDTPMYRKFRLDDHTFEHVPPDLTSEQHQKFTLNKDYIRVPNYDFLVDDPEVVANLPPKITWRITKSKNGKKGQFVKINQWPSLQIKRNTDTDWGWTLDGMWVKYQSCSPATVSKSRSWMYDPTPDSTLTMMNLLSMSLTTKH